MPPNITPRPWTKAIPESRDRLQSSILVWTVTPLLAIAAIAPAVHAVIHSGAVRPQLIALIFSTAFAALVWILRSATFPAAAIGWLACMVLAQSPSQYNTERFLPFPDEISALISLFVLTFLATRYGRARKEVRGLAEARAGRRASQVIANLGVAALCSSLVRQMPIIAIFTCIAALAEATADTVSSEIGQAIGGPAFLITTFRRVPGGTDGAISLSGTVAGLLSTAVITYAGLPGAHWSFKFAIFIAASAGLFFDSLLGATIERRGWIGNDLVNFLSTAFAAAVSLIAIRFAQQTLLR